MKVNIQLCLLCLCAAVALVECGSLGEDWKGVFEAMKQDDDDVLTFTEMYWMPKEELKEKDPLIAPLAIAEFDGMDTNHDGVITLDEFLTKVKKD